MQKIIILIAVVLTFASAVMADATVDAKLEYNKGLDYYHIGEFDKAVSSFRKAIDLYPDYVDAYYNLGSILEYIQQDEAALGVYKQIISRKPNDYEALFKAGNLCVKLNDMEYAKRYFSMIPSDNAFGRQAKTIAARHGIELDFRLAEQSRKNNLVTENEGSKLYNNITTPTGMVTDSNGILYVASFGENSITKIMPDGARVLFAKNGKVNGPVGMAIDADDNIYVANYNANNILKITKNGVITVLLGNVGKPYGLFLNGKVLYISAQASSNVIRYRLPQ